MPKACNGTEYVAVTVVPIATPVAPAAGVVPVTAGCGGVVKLAGASGTVVIPPTSLVQLTR